MVRAKRRNRKSSHESQKRQVAAKTKASSFSYAKRAATKEPGKEVVPLPDKPKGYRAYIASGHWKMFRMSIIIKRGQQCQRCLTRGPVDLHHNTYANLFNEKPEDVELLCRSCHEIHHGITTKPKSAAVAKKMLKIAKAKAQ